MVVELLDEDIAGLVKLGCDRLLVDLDVNGWPVRELGLLNGRIVHRFPSQHLKTHSLFSDGPIVVSSKSGEDLAGLQGEFEALWNSGAQ